MLSNKLAISSVSLTQHPSYLLDHKIRAAAQHGFAGIEIVFGDLKAYSEFHKLSVLDGAARIRDICDKNKLAVLSLAPFENFEGYNSPLSERLAVASLWFDVARKLRAPYLQVPSQFTNNCTGDETVIISELRQLADLGSFKQPIISIAYEPLSWGTHCSTWQSSLAIVESVNRPNFGLCLDSFHEVTKLWGDAFSTSGKYPDGDAQLQRSLRQFLDQCPLDKISFIQFSDGERFNPPFSKAHSWYLEGEAPQFTWSKHARPFPLEAELGGYMPVAEIARSWIVDKGYTGWVSLETFDWRMRHKDFRPEEGALRGRESWRKLQNSVRSPAAKI